MEGAGGGGIGSWGPGVVEDADVWSGRPGVSFSASGGSRRSWMVCCVAWSRCTDGSKEGGRCTWNVCVEKGGSDSWPLGGGSEW